jgi:hypothetical protein
MKKARTAIEQNKFNELYYEVKEKNRGEGNRG